VTLLLFATIWIALVLFAVGEYGKRLLRDRGVVSQLFWWAWAIGWAICAAHIVLALAREHDWNHAIAWQVTETRTRATFGFGWGGFVFVNYLFLFVWALELWRWRVDAGRYARQSLRTRAVFRTCYFVMILNAAVIFAAGPRRAAGVALVAALLWIWRPLVSSSRVGAHALGRRGY
jgi:hypothetical protein